MSVMVNVKEECWFFLFPPLKQIKLFISLLDDKPLDPYIAFFNPTLIAFKIHS